LAEALSNEPIGDSVTFKAGIAQYRLGKVVSAWCMNAISKWRYSSYGRGMRCAADRVAFLYPGGNFKTKNIGHYSSALK
jgi:hypothetical protein